MPISDPPCGVARREFCREGPALGKDSNSCRIKYDGIFGRDRIVVADPRVIGSRAFLGRGGLVSVGVIVALDV